MTGTEGKRQAKAEPTAAQVPPDAKPKQVVPAASAMKPQPAPAEKPSVDRPPQIAAEPMYPFGSFRDALIRTCYRVILSREPEPDVAARLSAQRLPPPLAAVVERVVSDVFKSPEGRSKARRFFKMEMPNPYNHLNHKTICLIHLEKTGGKTLDAALRRNFRVDEIYEDDGIELYCYSPAELSKLKYIPGHHDYFETLFIPSIDLRRVSLFRKPLDRLLSFYQYHRAHDAKAELSNPMVVLARSLGPEAFFEHPTVRSSARVDNAYLHVFAASAAAPPSPRDARQGLFELACGRIESLDAVGLTDRMDESIECIFRALDLEVPKTVEVRNRWSDFDGVRPDVSDVKPVKLTPALRRILADLVDWDERLYSLAETRFETLKNSIQVRGGPQRTSPGTPVAS